MNKNYLSKKYNILLVHNYYQQKGGEDSVFEQEKELLIKNGHNVQIYIKNNNDIKEFNILKKIFLPFTTIFSFKTYKEIKKIIKDNNINIIHVHNTLNLISQSVYYVAKKLNIPIVQTVHNFRMLCPNGLFYRDNHICEDCPNKGLRCSIKYKCYRHSRLQSLIIVLMMKIHRFTKIYKYVNYIFLTEFNKNKFREYNQKLNIFDESKFFVKPNFIEQCSISKMTKLNQYIYIGRLEEEKGIKDVIELWQNIYNAKLIVFGKGTLENELKNYVAKNKLNVEFKGFVSHEIIDEDLKRAKALIFPSKLYEGFPMSILDSIKTYTPIIAFNLGNAASIVEKNLGILYNNDDELIDIINNNKIANFIPKVNKLFWSNENIKLLEKIYEDIEG